MDKTVLLLHPNHYFLHGLECLIRQWFHAQDQEVSISYNPAGIDDVDIIFTCASSHSQKLWRHLRPARHPALLFLLVTQKDIHCCGFEDGKIAITDRPEKLVTLLNTVVANRQPPRSTSPPLSHCVVQNLSPREREVLWGYKQGLDNHLISKKTGLSLKAISSYKNHAMKKLQLKNHADLHYWMNSIAAQGLARYFRRKNIFIP